ncbi:MAG: histidine kinase [Flavobacteriaceae bacterium]|jgi:signal transduction histidine kinase|nr:histidine kinase [Flavobacteriaceae bacterium]
MKELDTFIILFTIVILMMVSIMFIIYSVFIKKKTQLILKESSFENELANSQTEIKEQTLNYVGQELHDNIGQKLTVARMMTNHFDKNQQVLELNQLLGECIQDIRNLSKTFITEDVLHFGIINSLEKEIKRIKELNLIEVDFQTNKDDIDLNPKHSLILFRIIQENISNVLKHSQATLMKIHIEDSPGNFKVLIEDNGKGISVSSKTGSGHTNMANRAKIINTDLKIESTENSGTKIMLNYPKQ